MGSLSWRSFIAPTTTTTLSFIVNCPFLSQLTCPRPESLLGHPDLETASDPDTQQTYFRFAAPVNDFFFSLMFALNLFI